MDIFDPPIFVGRIMKRDVEAGKRKKELLF
jgi:hypothetical protein